MSQESEFNNPATSINTLRPNKDNSKQKLKTINLPLNIFPFNEEAKAIEQVKFKLNSKDSEKVTYVIHRAYITQRYNQRKGTANTLTRSEVRGGGRKPWRQKGTGRARAGSNRSPLWRGGGVSFGPKVKVYFNKINRKEWRLALRSLLIKKAKNILIIDNLEHIYKQTKTSIFKLNFEKLGIKFQQKVVIIFNPNNSSSYNLFRITKNIKTIKVLAANRLNIQDLINAEKVLIVKDSLKLIEETYGQ